MLYVDGSVSTEWSWS